MAINTLSLRHDLLQAVRQYFYDQGLQEVTTPTLGHYGASDPNLINLTVTDAPANIGGDDTQGGRYYLQTSPEYAMKRLLAQHRQSIFQICAAYRGGESGERHRPEFQMLEWYRCGFGLAALMDDVSNLLRFCADRIQQHQPDQDSLFNYLAEGCPERVEYQTLFRAAFGLNPHTATVRELAALATAQGVGHLPDVATHADQRHGSRPPAAADYLDALFALVIEPELRAPTIVYDFPACQAALARIHHNSAGDRVSARFELYALGMELANAYDELNDAAELRRRFAANNQIRRARGLPEVPDDDDLLAVISHMPDCAGVALGIDRLLMTFAGANSIKAVRLL